MKSSRREFVQTLGGAAAVSVLGSSPALGAARAPAAPDERALGYCIVGLGRISMNEFMPGVAIAKRSRLVALVSGHRDKAERMAEKYAIDRKNIYSYDNYDEIARNPAIDAVYIALPNNMHAEYSIRAARAGKHVLSEKPTANSPEDVERMIDALRRAGKKLMIAYRCQYEPTHLRAMQMIREGRIGRLETIEATLGFNIRAGEWRLSKKMAGGGPLMDVGIYCIQACRYLSGEEPAEVRATWSVIDKASGRFAEVEENVAWTMTFPSGVLAACTTSYGANTGNRVRVMGTNGWLMLEPAYSYDGLSMTYQVSGSPPVTQPADDPNPRQFAREADHLAACVFEDTAPKTAGEEGLRDARIIAAIYESCQSGRAVKL